MRLRKLKTYDQRSSARNRLVNALRSCNSGLHLEPLEERRLLTASLGAGSQPVSAGYQVASGIADDPWQASEIELSFCAELLTNSDSRDQDV